jgi:hypothetical protein
LVEIDYYFGTIGRAVHQNDNKRVVYVNESGVIVQSPGSTVTTITTEPTGQQVITYQQIERDLPRHQLIEKDDDEEVYLGRQTGQKVKIERED